MQRYNIYANASIVQPQNESARNWSTVINTLSNRVLYTNSTSAITAPLPSDYPSTQCTACVNNCATQQSSASSISSSRCISGCTGTCSLSTQQYNIILNVAKNQRDGNVLSEYAYQPYTSSTAPSTSSRHLLDSMNGPTASPASDGETIYLAPFHGEYSTGVFSGKRGDDIQIVQYQNGSLAEPTEDNARDGAKALMSQSGKYMMSLTSSALPVLSQAVSASNPILGMGINMIGSALSSLFGQAGSTLSGVAAGSQSGIGALASLSSSGADMLGSAASSLTSIGGIGNLAGMMGSFNGLAYNPINQRKLLEADIPSSSSACGSQQLLSCLNACITQNNIVDRRCAELCTNKPCPIIISDSSNDGSTPHSTDGRSVFRSLQMLGSLSTIAAQPTATQSTHTTLSSLSPPTFDSTTPVQLSSLFGNGKISNVPVDSLNGAVSSSMMLGCAACLSNNTFTSCNSHCVNMQSIGPIVQSTGKYMITYTYNIPYMSAQDMYTKHTCTVISHVLYTFMNIILTRYMICMMYISTHFSH